MVVLNKENTPSTQDPCKTSFCVLVQLIARPCPLARHSDLMRAKVLLFSDEALKLTPTPTPTPTRTPEGTCTPKEEYTTPHSEFQPRCARDGICMRIVPVFICKRGSEYVPCIHVTVQCWSTNLER
jgi:hypothetical protein